MTSHTYFVTGANKGIGYEFVKQIVSDPKNLVIATARNLLAANELQELAKQTGRIHIVKLDVASSESIHTVTKAVSAITDSIDVFISNAALTEIGIEVLNATEEQWLSFYRTNTLGPILLVKELFPFLEKGGLKRLAFVSSLAGSISTDIPLLSYGYGQSKAALNHSARQLSLELKSQGFAVSIIHPGLVATEKSKAVREKKKTEQPELAEVYAKFPQISPETSVKGILKVIADSKPGPAPFVSHDGAEIPW